MRIPGTTNRRERRFSMLRRCSNRSFATLAASTTIAALVAGGSLSLAAGSHLLDRGKKRGERFTLDFRLEDCTFVTDDGAFPGGNPFFPLVPGNQLVLENEEDGERIEITTSLADGSNCSKHDGTPVPGIFMVALDGIDTRVVEEREWEDGELAEISQNYFARCLENGSVLYFGETVEDIEGGA